MRVEYELSPSELEDILNLLKGICDVTGVRDSVSRTVFERLHEKYCKQSRVVL